MYCVEERPTERRRVCVRGRQETGNFGIVLGTLEGIET